MAMPAGLNAQPSIRLPVGRRSVLLLATAIAATLLIAPTLGWFARAPWVQAAYLAAGSVLIGTIVGLGFLKLFPARPVFTWSVLIIAGSMIRIALSLLLAAGLFFRFRPEVAPFWGAYLAASVAVLAVEVVTVRPLLLGAAAPESSHA
jgi:hypothetical protein